MEKQSVYTKAVKIALQRSNFSFFYKRVPNILSVTPCLKLWTEIGQGERESIKNMERVQQQK